jgi:UDP:flavonoid glycosyltransferase YjiC (YdhE family)
MRVLFTSWAGGGHFAPLVPLGWALRAAGHEVLVACHPGQTDPILRAGLPALPVGPDVDMFALFRAKRRGGTWRPRETSSSDNLRGYVGMLETAEAVADVLADELVEFCRGWRPDLVLYEPASVVGPLVARLLDIPAVRQLWTSDFTAPVNGFPATVTGELADRFGLDGFGTAGDLTLDPCPPRMQVRDDLPRQPVRYIPYNGPAVLAPWLREPPVRWRVCVTWGTSLRELGVERMQHVPRVVRALGGVDAELVVAVLDSHRELFTDLPDNVRAIGPTPLHLLLPTCDAIVHQGGGGTLMTAVACGTPQVIIPSIADQTFNADHVAATGAGVHVRSHEDVTAEEVCAHTLDVLADPAYRLAARQLQTEHLSRPAPAEVVPVLERLALDRALAPRPRASIPSLS